MDLHAFEISFPLEYQPPLWRLKPANFLSHFVGHEGPGSLYSYLKNRGWVIALSAGNQDLARAFATFKITVHLTEEGFSMHFVLRKKNYSDCLFRKLSFYNSRCIQIPQLTSCIQSRGISPEGSCRPFRNPVPVFREEES